MSAKAENSETVGRGRRGGRRRRFVAPRPDATLSHLVKIFLNNTEPSCRQSETFRYSLQFVAYDVYFAHGTSFLNLNFGREKLSTQRNF
jgi:hypothetical protein